VITCYPKLQTLLLATTENRQSAVKIGILREQGKAGKKCGHSMASFEAAKAWDWIIDWQRLESSGLTYADGARIFQIRNPKHEIRNNPKIQIPRAQNKTHLPSMRFSDDVCPCVFWTFELRVLNLFRISDFEFRILHCLWLRPASAL
jgi:hypothetical protein